MPPLLAVAGETGYNRKILSCDHATAQEIYPSSRRRSSFCEPCSILSQAADSSLLGPTPLSLFSLDQTANPLIAARNHYRSWEKQARTHGRKRTFTKTSRPARQVCSNLEADPHHSFNQTHCCEGRVSFSASSGSASFRPLLICRGLCWLLELSVKNPKFSGV